LKEAQSAGNAAADAPPPRPFLFLAQFWGEQYRNYFVNYCLPSLLAPSNLPLLNPSDGHAFLIATPREDWNAFEQLPVMQQVRRFVTPVLIETPPPRESDYASILRHQTLGLKHLFEAAYARGGFGCAVWPDTIMSEGFVASMQRWAQAGYHLVMHPTVRLAQEGVFADLQELQLLPRGDNLADTGRALCVPQRVAADLSVRHLHPEILCLEEGNPLQPPHPPYRFWRVLEGRGLILHVFFATPVLMDFTSVPANHVDCLSLGDWETYYVGRNFSSDRLYVVADSDESVILSFTPADVNRASQPEPTRRRSSVMENFSRLRSVRSSLAIYGRQHRNLIRREMFRVSVRWHANDLDPSWEKEERRINNLIQTAAGDYFDRGAEFPPRIASNPRYALLDLVNEANALTGVVSFCARTLIGAIHGAPDERARVRRWLNRLRRP
jgi:hypothetical protein